MRAPCHCITLPVNPLHVQALCATVLLKGRFSKERSEGGGQSLKWQKQKTHLVDSSALDGRTRVPSARRINANSSHPCPCATRASNPLDRLTRSALTLGTMQKKLALTFVAQCTAVRAPRSCSSWFSLPVTASAVARPGPSTQSRAANPFRRCPASLAAK